MLKSANMLNRAFYVMQKWNLPSKVKLQAAHLSLSRWTVFDRRWIAYQRRTIDDNGDIINKQTVRMSLVARQFYYVHPDASEGVDQSFMLLPGSVGVDRLTRQ